MSDGFDAFLKIEGIEGESRDSAHLNESALISFSFGAMRSALAGGAAGEGQVQLQDLSLVKQVDRASPLLFGACGSGKRFKSAVLTVRKAGGAQRDYLTVTLNDVVVSSIATFGGTGSSELPTEELRLNFTRITFAYLEQDEQGFLKDRVSGYVDVKENRAG